MTVAVEQQLSESPNPVLKRLASCGVVPILTIHNETTLNDLDWLADALLAGGVDVVEVTLRTRFGLDAIEKLAARKDLTVGAGTVVTTHQVRTAIDAGAEFVVSPGFDVEVVNCTLAAKVPVLPGVATASEIQQAMKLGLKFLKLFPAEQLGGLAAVGALAGPFPDIRFMVSGGVTAENAIHYLEHPAVFAVGASWITSEKQLVERDSEAVARLALQSRRGTTQ